MDLRDETILIVDPDSVFVRPVIDPGPIKTGEAHSEEHDYMGVDIPGNRTVIDRHCREELRAKIQPVGIYVFINRGCLAELARRWLQKSIDIASDPVCREALGGTGWLSDMWGYAIAAAELGIHHRLRGFSQVTGSNSLKNPITHYCFPLMEKRDEIWEPDTQKPILWSKWTLQAMGRSAGPLWHHDRRRAIVRALTGPRRHKEGGANQSAIDVMVSNPTS